MKNPYAKLNPALLQEREKRIHFLKNNRHVRSFLRKYNIDFSVVEKNTGAFEDYLEQIRQCQSCKGLEFCTQPIRGQAKTLVIEDGFPENEFVLCKFAREQARETAFLNNYLINDTEKECQDKDWNHFEIPDHTPYGNAYVQIESSRRIKKGIFLFGQPGTGKSYLLTMLTHTLAKEGKKVAFVKVPKLISEIKQNITDNRMRTNLVHALQSCEVLVLDDIGSEAITPWTRDEILFPILDYRMTQHKKTYFTSNYTLDELKNNYSVGTQTNGLVASGRLLERITTLSNPVELTGESRRK